MRCLLPLIVVGFVAVLAVCAGDGVPPRANSSDYPVHRDTQKATIAPTLVSPELAKKIFSPEVNKNFLVVEVAVFRLERQTAHVDSFDFGLEFGGGEIRHPRLPGEIVSAWMEQGSPQPPSGVGVTAETGVVYTGGNDPATGRSHGWGTYSGVGVGSGDPTPPLPPSTDPRDFEANLRAKALPAARPSGLWRDISTFRCPPRSARTGRWSCSI
jgi:hypothetical protein